MCCYKNNGMCDLCREFQFSLLQNLFKSFSGAAPKIESGKFLQDDISNTLYPPSPPEFKPSPAELANDLLQQLETQCKRDLYAENIFPNWLEEKVELSIFENIPQVPERAELPLVPLPAAAYPQTARPTDEELLREFETVYDAVELTHLTPPQSPPGPATQLLLSYAQQAQCAPADHWPVAAPAPSAPAAPAAPAPAAPYDYDAASLEELIRQGAAQLGAPSPCASARSSPSCSPRSSTDEEWGAPARGKPYARGDDRRSRKKEQNKNAATRYRQKKKAEVEVLLNEEAELRKRHADLGEKCSDVQREIRYIKGLMRDLFKAKGLIK